MNQEDLARQMNSVVYAQRKLAYLQEKLQEVQASDPIMLAPGQRTLSVIDVVVAATHEQLLREAQTAIEEEEHTVQEQTTALLRTLPEIIKELIRKGMPLIAGWPAEGIQSLALVYQEEKFRIVPDDKRPS